MAARLAGPEGRIVGVDLQPMEPFEEKNITLLQADIASEAGIKEITATLGSKADCILSDLSPRLTGIRDADVSRSLELCRSALRLASGLLRPGGHLLVKTFVGEELRAYSEELARRFRTVERTRPEATRRGSSEIYICAKGFRGATLPREGVGREDCARQNEGQQL